MLRHHKTEIEGSSKNDFDEINQSMLFMPQVQQEAKEDIISYFHFFSIES